MPERGILVWNPNPTLDIVSEIAHLESGKVHRALSQTFSAGGKGTLVVRALTQLGISCSGVTPLAGPTGDVVFSLLQQEGLPIKASFTQGDTRAAITLNEISSGIDTVINGPGPATADQSWDDHLDLISGEISRNSPGTFVIAGRPPLSCSVSDLLTLISQAKTCGCRVVLDLSMPFAKKALEMEPWLIKVNRSEASDIAGLSDSADCFSLARALCAIGGENAIVTDSSNPCAGCLLGEQFKAIPAEIDLRSAVGCGDCFLAGLLFGLSSNPNHVQTAIRWAMATAGAAAETIQPGEFVSERVFEIYSGAQEVSILP